MISIERDTHGRTYQIWQQQQANSCGIASCWMARSIALQMSFAQEEWDYAVRTFASAVGGALGNSGLNPEAPMTLADVSTDDGGLAAGMSSFGFYGAQLATALRAEGLTVEDTFNNNNAMRIAHNKISLVKPAICLVNWTDGPGGHFIVVGRATSREVTFLDPWDGHANQQSNDGTYVANYGRTGICVEILYVKA